jgi:enoyl-CoA hydratase/3-hydroxyacyl-CoA dehydrogenase
MTKICVVGAGNMGAGIAQRCAQSGFAVSMVDIKEEFVKKGFDSIRKTLDEGVKRGKVKPEQVDAIIKNIHGTIDLKEAAADADIVIEAVFEDLEVKKKLFGDLDKFCKPDAILATNTSSLSVNEMAAVTSKPAKFSGLHFFYPAAINQLIEVIPGDKTAPDVVSKLIDVSRLLGKLPIVVKDAPGFAVNRYFVPFLNEAVKMLDEGVATMATIEESAKKSIQIPMGPFELMNATGVQIAYHAQESLHKALGQFYKPANGLKKQFESGQKWTMSGTVELEKMDKVGERFLGMLFTIALHLVEEGVATKEAVERGATVGLRWKLGPFAMMNEIGIEKSLHIVDRFCQSSGLKLPDILVKQAESKEPWYLRSVRTSREGSLGIITVDRPDSLNALNSKVLTDLGEAVDNLAKDEAVKVVMVTGEGGAFVAGADIKEMIVKTPMEARDFTYFGQSVLKKLEDMEKVSIAAVNGYALGGGLELALSCDLIVVAEGARLGLPEVTLGIHPGFGGTQRLSRQVGKAKAKELIYTGSMIDAKEAERIGLVNKVVPRDRLYEEVKKLADKIAANGPVAVKLAKAAINRGTEVDLVTGLAYEVETISLCFSTEDKKEGMGAFIEKRKPQFKGK